MEGNKVNMNQYLIEYLKQNKILFFIYILLLFIYPLHKVILPKYYGKVISSLNKNKNTTFLDNVKILLFIFVVYNILMAILQKVHGSFIPGFSEYSIQRIFSNLLQNKTLNYENLEVGEILAKIIKVPGIIYRYLDLLRSLVFSQLFITVGTMWYYSTISNRVLYLYIGLSLGLVFLQIITYYSTMDIEIKREKEKDSIYQHFQDLLNNIISVVVCKQEKHENNVLHEKFKPFIDIFFKSLNLNFIYRIIFAIYTVIAFILLNLYLYFDYESKQINKEEFISSFIVTYSILHLFTDANYSLRSVVDMYSQVKEMENYFNEKSDLDEDMRITKEDQSFSNGVIEFKNIDYQYEDNKEFKGKYTYALKNVNIKIEKNENIAIIGQIGSGKSTLVKLLLKFFEPSQGEILINNINLKHISRDELYDHVFYIPQKPKLLNRTLYENIFYGIPFEKKDKSMNVEKIKTIMKNMKLEENIIDIFVEKMDQSLGNDGIKLSGGQRQMVWIIRAMLRDPAIIIFDEPTSALDKKNKDNIINVIKEIGREKTILIISHDDIDPSIRKIVMKQGEVVKQSSYMESPVVEPHTFGIF
jgi:ABC-type multidrug transport system fused ATPase/permease subunit